MLEVAVPNWLLESPALDLSEFFTIDKLEANLSALLDGHFDVLKSKHRIAVGADKIDLQLFQRDQDKHLRAIQRKVSQGRYTFSPLLEHEIPKVESKELRTISIASIRDTIVQRSLYEYFYEAVEGKLQPHVFGYRRGKSAHDAIRAIQANFANGLVAVFDADLTKFFDRVVHDVLLEKIDGLAGVDPIARKLILRFLRTGRVPAEQVAEVKNAKGKDTKYRPQPRSVGVPQGGVLSGMLSNLYLAEFDRAILSEFHGYVRYADDFLVCCRTESECFAVKKLVAKCLPTGAELNLDKTTDYVSAERGVDFLGFRIRPNRLSVRGRNVGKFKDRIRKIFEQHANKNYPNLGKALEYVVPHLKLKIEGPEEGDLQKYANVGARVALYKRSWIGFLRIVDDDEQLKKIDRWIISQFKAFAWRNFGVSISREQIRGLGLPSLVNTKYKALSSKMIEPELGEPSEQS